MRKVIVRCSTGGWVFWFDTLTEARLYAKAVRAMGNKAKIEK